MQESALCAILYHMYTPGACLRHGLCSLLESILLVSLMCMWLIYKSCVHSTYQNYNCYIPLIVMKSFPMLSTACQWSVFDYCASAHQDNLSIFSAILITLTIALYMNDNHKRYYHMDSKWLVGLTWSYFSHPIWSSNVGVHASL